MRAGPLLRALLPAGLALLLGAGLLGGLLRAGVAVPLPDAAWPGRAVLAHAFLMIGALMGSVIGLERAVALKARAAFAVPLASAAAGLLMLAGSAAPAAWLAVAAAAGFVGVNLLLVERQSAPHTRLLLLGAAAWLVGNLLHALGARPAAVVPWWFNFLVLTIAAERLEMTRLMRRRRAAAPALYAVLGLLLAGAAGFALAPVWGSLLYGAALVALAAWLIAFDIARRTIAARGLSRYMALCLLLGYAWLALAGLAWIAAGFGLPARDAALHALGLGFVLGMMFGHAPVILPALLRVKLQFGALFYVPLALLHLSLALRLAAAPLAEPLLLRLGALGNLAAIVLFAATMRHAARAWRQAHPDSARPSNALAARH